VVYLSKINIRNIWRNIKILQPDIIYLNSFFSKMTQVVLFLRKIKLIKNKIILAPRGELSHGAISLKSKKKKVFLSVTKIFRFHGKDLIFHATDKIEKFDIEKLYPNKVVEIPNLINNQICEFNNFKKETGTLNIVFLSRISEKKNLLYALKILQAVGNKNIVFDIYGPKEDLEYWKKCKQVISTLCNIKISYKGSASPADISTILSNYHCFFLPTLNENFGHAIVESMQIGLIPIISNQTPWIDLQKYDAGWSLNLNDKLSFINAFDMLYEMDNERFQAKSKNIRKYIKLKLDNKDSIDLHKNMFYFE
jgi:glycosyltransferase involved in cell wall biosynthesis